MFDIVAGYDVLYSHPDASKFLTSTISVTIAISTTRLCLIPPEFSCIESWKNLCSCYVHSHLSNSKWCFLSHNLHPSGLFRRSLRPELYQKVWCTWSLTSLPSLLQSWFVCDHLVVGLVFVQSFQIRMLNRWHCWMLLNLTLCSFVSLWFTVPLQ